MPPSSKRRRTSGAAVVPKTSQQSTISFRTSKVGPSNASNKLEPLPKVTDSKVLRTSEPDDHERVINEKIAQNESPLAKVVGDTTAQTSEEEETIDHADSEEQELHQIAIGLSEARIKSYWKAKERERKAPRLHQCDLDVREKILREFDMSSRFGPGIGISRYDRWHRAYNLSMNPPIEVLAVLLKETQSSVQRDTEQSIVEELIASRKVRGDTVAEA